MLYLHLKYLSRKILIYYKNIYNLDIVFLVFLNLKTPTVPNLKHLKINY